MIPFYTRFTKQCGREPTMCDVGGIWAFHILFIFFIKSHFCHNLFFFEGSTLYFYGPTYLLLEWAF